MNEVRDHQPKPIPLFIYWHQGWEEAPDIVLACRDSWKKHHPTRTNFEVVSLCNASIQSWLDKCSAIDQERLEFFKQRLESSKSAGSLAFYTDYLRLVLTETHGGFWIDATVYCLSPLKDWIPPSTACLFPLSMSPDRLFEVWFIDNRAKDPLISEWKEQLAKPHFSLQSYTRYRDDWTTKPYMTSHWLFKVSRRSWIFSGFIWNSVITKKWLRIRPYFMTNYALHKVISSPNHFEFRHTHILPVNLKELIALESFEKISSLEQGYHFTKRVPFIKLSHKKDWDEPNSQGISLKGLLAHVEAKQTFEKPLQ